MHFISIFELFAFLLKYYQFSNSVKTAKGKKTRINIRAKKKNKQGKITIVFFYINLSEVIIFKHFFFAFFFFFLSYVYLQDITQDEVANFDEKNQNDYNVSFPCPNFLKILPVLYPINKD